MSDDSPLADLVRRVRAGEEDAAAELVRRYEPAVRRAVRFRLRDARLGTLFDSMDICQSVLASFFVRAASGQFDLDRPEQLIHLLVGMARNKLNFQARKQHAQRRDVRRARPLGEDDGQLAGHDGTPSRKVAAGELLAEVRRRLSAEELQLVEWRNQGLEWAEIAERLHGSAEALRKKHARALDRIAQELHLDELGDE
jgi:RNA polymerase sigma-70 factor (ECF subfamily)